MTNTSTSIKRPNNEWLKFCSLVQELEMDAQDRAWTGLATSLSNPFQRLLEYLDLFQVLLSHTDWRTPEYEGTLQLVAEAEDIIRGIEDAKNYKEELNKTRDILARIKGLEKVKQFTVPKPSRVLVEELMLKPRESSDVLQSGGGGIGSRKDLWLVVFNDVVLRCQCTGILSLPPGAAHSSRPNSISERQGNSKCATGRRKSSALPRNLYKFIKASFSSF
jgi:hypothetical protein